MLKNIDPLLTPDLLRALAAMGHGDVIAICDANFPAYSVADDKPLIHVPSADVVQMLQAILTLLPVDTFDDEPISTMQVVGDPGAEAEIHKAAREQVFAKLDPVPAVKGIERFAYYEAARKAVAVVLTGEQRPYGNFLVRKGVIF